MPATPHSPASSPSAANAPDEARSAAPTEALATPTLSAPAEPGPRFVAERQQRIAQALGSRGRVEVATLAAEFGVSEDTVRRDLRQLAARGLLLKTHGGAVAPSMLMPAVQRLTLAPAAKQAIALRALQQVQAHQTLFLDGGSTVLALAQALRNGQDAPRPLTVVTHALDVALALADEAQITLVLAGGQWQPHARIFTGAAAEDCLLRYRADIAFLGACGMHPRTGLTAGRADEAPLKRAMLQGAAWRLVLSDHSKLHLVGPHAVASADEVDEVITDAPVAWLQHKAVVVS